MFLISLIKRQLKAIDSLIDETTRRLSDYDGLPDRTLVFRVRGIDKLDYYEQEYLDGKKKLYPLGKNSKTVGDYKRQRYLREKLDVLQKDKKAAEQFLTSFQDFSPEAIQRKLPLAYKGLTANSYEEHPEDDHDRPGLKSSPSAYSSLPENIYTDERFLKISAWASQKYKRNPIPLPDDPNVARDGTPMRSKGECMWYDNILFEGLPARIDPELSMQGKSRQWHKLYPDFQFMCFDGSFILVEHFGKWDDEDYAERNKRKIQEYLDCGFVIGDNLVVTSDNIDHRTNELVIIEALEKIKKRMFE